MSNLEKAANKFDYMRYLGLQAIRSSGLDFAGKITAKYGMLRRAGSFLKLVLLNYSSGLAREERIVNSFRPVQVNKYTHHIHLHVNSYGNSLTAISNGVYVSEHFNQADFQIATGQLLRCNCNRVIADGLMLESVSRQRHESYIDRTEKEVHRIYSRGEGYSKGMPYGASLILTSAVRAAAKKSPTLAEGGHLTAGVGQRVCISPVEFLHLAPSDTIHYPSRWKRSYCPTSTPHSIFLRSSRETNGILQGCFKGLKTLESIDPLRILFVPPNLGRRTDGGLQPADEKQIQLFPQSPDGKRRFVWPLNGRQESLSPQHPGKTYTAMTSKAAHSSVSLLVLQNQRRGTCIDRMGWEIHRIYSRVEGYSKEISYGASVILSGAVLAAAKKSSAPAEDRHLAADVDSWIWTSPIEFFYQGERTLPSVPLLLPLDVIHYPHRWKGTRYPTSNPHSILLPPSGETNGLSQGCFKGLKALEFFDPLGILFVPPNFGRKTDGGLKPAEEKHIQLSPLSSNRKSKFIRQLNGRQESLSHLHRRKTYTVMTSYLSLKAVPNAISLPLLQNCTRERIPRQRYEYTTDRTEKMKARPLPPLFCVEPLPGLLRGTQALLPDKSVPGLYSPQTVHAGSSEREYALHKNPGTDNMRVIGERRFISRTGDSSSTIVQQTGLIHRKSAVREAPADKTSCLPEERTVQQKEVVVQAPVEVYKQGEGKEMSVYHVNLLADRVYKIIEKRIAIEKDRRGLL